MDLDHASPPAFAFPRQCMMPSRRPALFGFSDLNFATSDGRFLLAFAKPKHGRT
jgi:hypothetical protein